MPGRIRSGQGTTADVDGNVRIGSANRVQPEIMIAFIGNRAKHYALNLVQYLRHNHVRAIVDTQERNLKGQMKYSNKVGVKYSIVIGDDEIESGELTLKNMETGEQTKIVKEEILDKIRRG